MSMWPEPHTYNSRAKNTTACAAQSCTTRGQPAWAKPQSARNVSIFTRFTAAQFTRFPSLVPSLSILVPAAGQQLHRPAHLPLTDPEAVRFDQMALFGVRKRMRGEHYDRNRALLVQMVSSRQMPALTGTETPYRVPPIPPWRSSGQAQIWCGVRNAEGIFTQSKKGSDLHLSHSRFPGVTSKSMR